MKKIKQFLSALFYLFLYFLLSIFMYSLTYTHINNTANFALSNAAMIFADLTVLFIFIIIFRKNIVPDFDDFKKNYHDYLNKNYKYWLIGLLVMVISNLVISSLIQNMPTNEEVNRQILFTNPISSFVSMVFITPIIEELITRKTFKDVFENQYLYIIMSGLIFGSLHLLSATSFIEVLYIIPYSALGCAFSKIYYNTDNIWSNIFFHSLHNFMAIILIFIGG